ncbi:TCR/Tet family MFS transporter [Sphingomonas sp. AX6]|uniref:TCR/Tet family MFS transporter n=1 Tax=Sphingomonas sp. AX6 TaxID=2653171 RepID=UPI0012F35460|nr:TCR/Tet family MFS transporter [Sphingomonas sp. AX6]VXC46428.1 MFS transporter [Sphingomonas sp. AX6]
MTALNRHRPAIAFVLVTAALDVMAMGLVIPVLPILIEEFAGSASTAGWWNGVMVALWALMQFVFSPIIGSLSDRFGRRPVILISIFGLAVDWVLMALAPNLWWLAVGRIIGGITSSSFTAVYAYLADIIPPEGRAKAYGLVGAAFSAGFIAGPALGGVLGEWGPRTPFWVAAALSALAFLYGLFVLPESLPKERRMAFAWSRANPLGAFRLLRRHAELTGLAWVYFMLYFAHHVFSAVFVLYAAHRYGFGPLETGLLLAFAGLLEMLVQIFLVGRVSARLGDRRTMVVGLVLGAFGILGMGLAPTGWLFIAALVPNALWSLALPTIQSLMTRLVSEREQGQLQGANNSVASVAGVISPLFFGAVYGVSVVAMPGLVFVIAAVVLLGGAAIGHFAGRGVAPASRS